MTYTENEAKAATPHSELIAELLSPNTPKTEREHAASREIERLQALAAPVQEPLHDEEVRLIAHNECPEDWNSLDNKECWLKGFVSGFKTAERERKA